MNSVTSCMKYVASAMIAFLAVSSGTARADLLLADYEGGGLFTGAIGAANQGASGLDPSGSNDAYDAGLFMTVDWATLWSGGSKFGAIADLSGNDTYSFDIRVGVGQPVEAGANFYAQLNDAGGGYFEQYISQTLILADGNWYRVKFPISGMNNVAAPNPAALTNASGVTLGMTFDSDGDDFLFKSVDIDNVQVTQDGVTGLEITIVPEASSLAYLLLGLVALTARRLRRK
ncbi:MAG: hypothetical protein KJ626_01635 [Verrucomicrobia bacterium]|nr:hypothetical protein [Verrucomicrobiota bacterium]